jgi:dephospho-CoA kinase
MLYADEIGRGLMQPGEAVYEQIVERFGKEILADAGQLDRTALARMAFGEGRIEELNSIVHPATIARQAELTAEIAARDPDAVVMVESALVFETRYGGEEGWHKRFDRIILVRASEETKVARFVARVSSGRALDSTERQELEADARRRMAKQLDDDWKSQRSDYVLTNDGPTEQLLAQVDALWPVLRDAARGPAKAARQNG